MTEFLVILEECSIKWKKDGQINDYGIKWDLRTAETHKKGLVGSGEVRWYFYNICRHFKVQTNQRHGENNQWMKADVMKAAGSQGGQLLDKHRGGPSLGLVKSTPGQTRITGRATKLLVGLCVFPCGPNTAGQQPFWKTRIVWSGQWRPQTDGGDLNRSWSSWLF